MAIEKRFNTRIVLTHDEYNNLKDKTLKYGEVILAKVGVTTGAEGQEPIWMMKVGKEGDSTKVANCPWLVAPAADVYDWAKQENLAVDDVPTLPIGKIDGLQTALDNKADKSAFDNHNHDSVYKKIQEAVAESGAADKTLKISQDAQGKISVTPVDIEITKSQITDFDHSHSITATDDDVIVATGGQLSVDVKHKKELGEGKSYTTAASTGAGSFDSTAVLNIPSFKVNEYGHITEIEDKEVNIKIPGLNEVAESAHTHANGKGTVITGEGAKSVDLNIALELIDGNIVIYDKDDSDKDAIASMSAADFIKDGMIQSVELVDDNGATGEDKVEGKFLKITWNTDADVDADDITYVDLSTLIDVYTAGAGLEIKNNEISIKDKGVTLEKLELEVQQSLARANNALQASDITGKADKVLPATAGNFASLGADGNLTDSGKKASDFATADHNHDNKYAPINIDTGVMSVAVNADTGLKATNENGAVTIDFIEDVVFVLDGGTAANL